MILRKLVTTPIIIPCLKCWGIGHLVIISKKKPSDGVLNFWWEFLGFQKTGYMLLSLKEAGKKTLNGITKPIYTGKKSWMKTGSLKAQKRIIFGKWAIRAHADRVLKFTSISDLKKKGGKLTAGRRSIKIIRW
ncbi:hypothetical protein ES708_32869 [subsurface metagenome]